MRLRQSLFLLFLLPSVSWSQAPNPMQADILAYQLTLPKANNLITATRDMTKYVMALPDFQQRMARMMTMSPAQQLAELENDAGAMKIVKQYGFTAKEYMVGVPALRMALMAAQGTTGPNVIASPANVAFARQNLPTLKPRADSLEAMLRPKPPGEYESLKLFP